MAKKRKQTLEVNGKPKNNKLYVGKIDGNELLMNRKGKVNTGSNPEMRSIFISQKRIMIEIERKEKPEEKLILLTFLINN